MLKVAILDDYQNVSQEFVDLKKLSGKYEFKIFSEPFIDEADAIEQLADFEALLIMRERTPITKNLIDNLNDLKYIITSGSRNKAIDFIKNLIAKPEMGKIYKGKVVKIMEFGAFVNFLGKQDGLVHISELAEKRVAKVGDVVKEGDEVSVKVVGFDRGKVKLSMKQANA